MAITTLAMVATVFVLNLYGMKEKPVPGWAKKLFIVYLARILCMCTCTSTPDTLDVESSSDHNKNRHNAHQRHSRDVHMYKGIKTLEESMPLKTQRSQSIEVQMRRGSRMDGGAMAPGGAEGGLTFMPSYDKTEQIKENRPKKPDYAKEWLHMAAVFDRFFFWLCLVFIVVTTMVLFHPLTTSKYFKVPSDDDDIESAEGNH